MTLFIPKASSTGREPAGAAAAYGRVLCVVALNCRRCFCALRLVPANVHIRLRPNRRGSAGSAVWVLSILFFFLCALFFTLQQRVDTTHTHTVAHYRNKTFVTQTRTTFPAKRVAPNVASGMCEFREWGHNRDAADPAGRSDRAISYACCCLETFIAPF